MNSMPAYFQELLDFLLQGIYKHIYTPGESEFHRRGGNLALDSRNLQQWQENLYQKNEESQLIPLITEKKKFHYGQHVSPSKD